MDIAYRCMIVAVNIHSALRTDRTQNGSLTLWLQAAGDCHGAPPRCHVEQALVASRLPLIQLDGRGTFRVSTGSLQQKH